MLNVPRRVICYSCLLLHCFIISVCLSFQIFKATLCFGSCIYMFGLLGGVRSVKCYHCSGADTIQPSLFFPFIVPCLFEKGDIVFSFPRYAMRGSASSDSKYLVSVTLPTALCKSFLKQVFVMVWICIWFRYTTQIIFIYFFQHFDFNHFPAHILSTHVGSTQLTHNVATTSLHRRCNVVVCWVWVLCVHIYYSFMQIFLKLYWCFVMVWRCVFDKKKKKPGGLLYWPL